jgi:OmpA-OmpF porin, OOP family
LSDAEINSTGRLWNYYLFIIKPTFMSFNLFDSVKGLFTNELIGKAASMLGESEGGVSKAIGGVLPTVLSGLLNKATSGNEGASGILNMAKEAAGSGILGNLGGLLGGDSGGGNLGGILNMASGLFGDKLGGIGKLISGFAGIKESSASSLLSMAAPAALGFLGKHAADNNLNATGLASLLSSQKDNIMNAMPAGLNLSGLGLGSIADKVKSFTGDTGAAASKTIDYASDTAAKADGSMKWLMPLLLLLAAGLLIWYFSKGCGGGDKTVPASADTVVANTGDKVKEGAAAIIGKIDSVTGDFIYDAGKMVDIDLPGGVKLSAGENSTEYKLYKFLSGSDAVDTVKGNWFDFTNVRFKTGSSAITDESMVQLKNMVAIAKAFPTARFKVGGYTDNVGDSLKNVKLSQKRAETVAAELVKLGAAKTSIVGSEGYGPQWPIGDNATKEGQAQNRRVSVRVKAK